MSRKGKAAAVEVIVLDSDSDEGDQRRNEKENLDVVSSTKIRTKTGGDVGADADDALVDTFKKISLREADETKTKEDQRTLCEGYSTVKVLDKKREEKIKRILKGRESG